MVKSDVIPHLARIAPPSTPEEAWQLVSNYGGAGADSLYGLVGCVFKDIAQFTAAMADCRLNLKVDELCNNGTIVTYKADARGADGTEWRFILNQVGSYRLDVINARLTRAGDVDPESAEVIKGIKETLAGSQ